MSEQSVRGAREGQDSYTKGGARDAGPQDGSKRRRAGRGRGRGRGGARGRGQRTTAEDRNRCR